ncbi:MAG: amidohydrolase [Bacteroidales bacterium]|nr:amidohydrolase [Bacteroidales bacterium]
MLRISLVQPDIIWKDIPGNLLNYEQMLGDLPETDLVIFPEMFATGFIADPRSVIARQELVMEWLSAQATDSNRFLVCSHPFCMEQACYNRLLVYGPGGRIWHYDKRHLFSYGGEKENYVPGKEQLLLDIKGWTSMPLTCYDLRFPVWSRNTMDYKLLIYVANWPSERMEIWETLLRARAIENQCYTIGVNRVGIDGKNINYTGRSLIAGPDGKVICSLNDKEGIVTHELLLSDLLTFRRKYPFLQDRDEFEFN